MSDRLIIKNKNITKLNILIKELPIFFYEYFLSLEETTSILTRINYATDLKIFCYYLINELERFKYRDLYSLNYDDFESVSPFEMQKYMQYLNLYTYYDKQYSNNERAKARKLSALKSLYKFLFFKDYISVNNTEKVKSPKLHEKEIIRLDIDEVVKIINQAEFGDGLTDNQKKFHNKLQKRDVALLTLFLGTGIRISECINLNISDINFKNDSFKIIRKGGNEAFLYFSDEVKKALMDYIEERKIIEKNFVKYKDKKDIPLFISLQNKRISTRAVQYLVKKYSTIVSPLKKISPHKLRSTYGTALYRETKDIYIVADVLGHKDINTTKKHYAAISEDIRKNASNKVKLR